MKAIRLASLLVLALAVAGCASPGGNQPTQTDAAITTAPVAALNVPVEYYKLSNGLRIVLSEDHSVPVATIGIYYNIGFRIEPKDRTGFAHLFEHLMFQGSKNLPKGEFFKTVEGLGGQLNGSTRFDYTNYYEAFPSNALETMLWAEADRMRSLDITQENLVNQHGVVKEEVKVNVLNQPYGGFPWLQLPQVANENWYNAHNFYGDLQHIDAATLEDARAFFETYYTPNNAVLVLVGDFESAQAKRWIEQYFASIPSRTTPPLPDISEPKQTAEKRVRQKDALAPRPALALGYHVPQRWTP
ncbi:MAG TPA: pitrilysin family protein, partial [Steroidobacteraceae bacterium]|nr:pitrilysin family protein [Steroidobacteraceae bacterium]